MFRLKTLAVVLMLLSLASCAGIKPWVQSHERGILADPIMAFESNPASTRYVNHVYEARESARGAEGSAGGGCGCN
ncbi:MAG: hypothetical protein ACI93R_002383 [Flavobacteriales bacterium]|jgi:hypothetical protein